MGLFRKALSVLSGSSEETLIKAKAEIGHLIESKTNPEYVAMTQYIAAEIEEKYNRALENIIYSVGNALNHHAHVSNDKYQKIKQSPFMYKYVDYYAKEVFAKGFYIGRMKRYNEEQKYIDDTNLLMVEIVNNMKEEATSLFSEKIAECFMYGTQKAFEDGALAGYNG